MPKFGKGIGRRNIDRIQEYFPEIDPDLALSYMGIVKNSFWLLNNLENFLALNGLSIGRLAILMELFSQHDIGPVSPAELAKHHGSKKATITGLLDTLERDGLVARSQNEMDRRKTDVKITAAGKKLIKEYLPRHYKVLSAAMDGFSEEERNQTYTVLSTMNHRIEEHNERTQKEKGNDSK